MLKLPVMKSVSLKIGDNTARFRCATLCSAALYLVMLASVLSINLFALYAFTYAPKSSTYYCLLVPLTVPVVIVSVYFHWLGMKLFKHA